MKSKITIIPITIALVVCFAVAPAIADWWPGDDYKMHWPQMPKPGGWDVEFAASRLADDWRCSETGPVSDIHFWISWMDDMVGPINDIRIGIWSNNPVGPHGFSVPGILLWERIFTSQDIIVLEWEPDLQGWFDPSSGYYEPQNHWLRFQINIENIQHPFIQEEGVIYWLEIDFGPLPFVGWKETGDHWNDAAVFWYSQNWWTLTDPITGGSIDLAFVITDDCCNGDGIRGNADDVIGPAGEIDVADLTYLVNYLFQGGPAPPCIDEGNADGIVGPGGPIDVADLTYLVDYLFQGGPAPPACP